MSWRALTRNLGWKLGSLVLAVILWFAIVGEPELVTTHSVPILYKNLPRELLIGADSPDAVRLELRGSSSKLSPANVSDLAVMIDLAGIHGPGEHTFTLSDNDLRLPQGVAFLRAVPSQLHLRFARLKTKDVPVTMRSGQALPAGYRIVRQEITPPELRIAGPEARVDQTASAQTDAIDLSGVTRTAEFHVSAFVEDPQVRLESSPMVTVKIVVEKTGN